MSRWTTEQSDTHHTGQLPTAVIGAGPIGLAAAAHLMEQGIDPLILEAGEQAGAAVAEWSHIRLFSPWRYNVDAAASRLLTAQGWQQPRPTELPTGEEFITQYLKPLAATAELAGRICFGQRVIAITRGGRDKTHAAARSGEPFTLRAQTAAGEFVEHRAAAIIDASGTWGSPNPLGGAGISALGEDDPALAPHLLGPLPDVLGTARESVTGRHILVTGSGHSAVSTLLNLVAVKREAPATQISWAIRSSRPERTYGAGGRDELPERGAIGQRLRSAVEAGLIDVTTSASICAVDGTADGQINVSFDDGRSMTADAIAAATGFRPDTRLLAELRVRLDSAVEAPVRLAPMIDPEFHSCGTVAAHGAEELSHPEDKFFIAGMKSYGRAPTFLMATGYEQVRSIAAHLAGQDAAARDLQLPETGVCSAIEPVGPPPA